MKMTTEEAFVKTLQMHGIQHAFGIIGSAMMPISDLFPAAGIKFWDCAHECNAGMSADGYTRATGKMSMAIANNPTPNYVLLIIDNGSYGSTGDQPTYAGAKTNLTDVAKACGCENVVEVKDVDTPAAVEKALAGDEMTIIISKCESGNVKVPVITLDPVVIRHRFMEAVAS